jgi:thioesterase domain-containing protein
VHSLGANLVSYGALAHRVGEDQPFYGLQPQGLDGKQPPHTRIEDMAAHYVEAIRTVQRHGPYYLGGVCLGGVIAFEMAQQLLAAGEQVAGLLLMDSYCPGTPRHLPRRALDYGLVEQMDWYVGETMLLPLPEKIKFVFARVRGFGGRLWYAVRVCIGRAVPAFAPAEAQVERIMAHVKAVNSQAWHHYVPRHYPGKIILFWCSEIPTRCYRDRRLAWSEIADGGLEVHAVPGNHMTMVEPPQVEILAQILRKCLQKVQQETEPLVRTAASNSC